MAATVCRSALYLPSSNPRAIEKSRGIDADCIIFDLEDAVGITEKAPARTALQAAFGEGDFGASTTAVRVNPIGSEDYYLDLQAVAECQPELVVLPKVSSVAEVQQFNSDAANAGLPATLGSWFMIESVAGLIDLESIAQAGVSGQFALQCLLVGTNDIARETGVATTDDRCYLLPWLMQIILVARHHRLQVLDGVWNSFRDMPGYEQQTRQAAQMGFDGKSLIHPCQVELANQLFSPSAQALDRARAIVAAFEQPANAGKNVIDLNGEMVERLHLEQAVQLLALASQYPAP